jgi:hypothetical protein
VVHEPASLGAVTDSPDEKQSVPLEIMRDFIAEGVRRINFTRRVFARPLASRITKRCTSGIRLPWA